MRTLILGGTGRLGKAVGDRLKSRGDEVYLLGRKFESIPEGINYAIFCQRYRGAESFDGEFTASCWLTHGVLQKLGFSDIGDCAVVIVSSVFGVSPGKESLSYNVGKAASLSLMQYQAATSGIRTNAVSPWAFTKEDPPVKMSDVVDVIEFLASPRSGGINGQNIVVDRGLGAKWRII